METTNQVNLNTSGYIITQDMLDSMDNVFLDMKDATLGSKFYFLEGHYDQIVLEQLYELLSTNSIAIDGTLTALTKEGGVSENLKAALETYNKFISLGAESDIAKANQLLEKLKQYTTLINGDVAMSDTCKEEILDLLNYMYSETNGTVTGQNVANDISLLLELKANELNKQLDATEELHGYQTSLKAAEELKSLKKQLEAAKILSDSQTQLAIATELKSLRNELLSAEKNLALINLVAKISPENEIKTGEKLFEKLRDFVRVDGTIALTEDQRKAIQDCLGGKNPIVQCINALMAKEVEEYTFTEIEEEEFTQLISSANAVLGKKINDVLVDIGSPTVEAYETMVNALRGNVSGKNANLNTKLNTSDKEYTGVLLDETISELTALANEELAVLKAAGSKYSSSTPIDALINSLDEKVQLKDAELVNLLNANSNLYGGLEDGIQTTYIDNDATALNNLITFAGKKAAESSLKVQEYFDKYNINTEYSIQVAREAQIKKEKAEELAGTQGKLASLTLVKDAISNLIAANNNYAVIRLYEAMSDEINDITGLEEKLKNFISELTAGGEDLAAQVDIIESVLGHNNLIVKCIDALASEGTYSFPVPLAVSELISDSLSLLAAKQSEILRKCGCSNKADYDMYIASLVTAKTDAISAVTNPQIEDNTDIDDLYADLKATEKEQSAVLQSLIGNATPEQLAVAQALAKAQSLALQRMEALKSFEEALTDRSLTDYIALVNGLYSPIQAYTAVTLDETIDGLLADLAHSRAKIAALDAYQAAKLKEGTDGIGPALAAVNTAYGLPESENPAYTVETLDETIDGLLAGLAPSRAKIAALDSFDDKFDNLNTALAAVNAVYGLPASGNPAYTIGNLNGTIAELRQAINNNEGISAAQENLNKAYGTEGIVYDGAQQVAILTPEVEEANKALVEIKSSGKGIILDGAAESEKATTELNAAKALAAAQNAYISNLDEQIDQEAALNEIFDEYSEIKAHIANMNKAVDHLNIIISSQNRLGTAYELKLLEKEQEAINVIKKGIDAKEQIDILEKYLPLEEALEDLQGYAVSQVDTTEDSKNLLDSQAENLLADVAEISDLIGNVNDKLDGCRALDDIGDLTQAINNNINLYKHGAIDEADEALVTSKERYSIVSSAKTAITEYENIVDYETLFNAVQGVDDLKNYAVMYDASNYATITETEIDGILEKTQEYNKLINAAETVKELITSGGAYEGPSGEGIGSLTEKTNALQAFQAAINSAELLAVLAAVNTAYEGAGYTVGDLNNATINSLISDAHGAKNSAESKIAALEAYQAINIEDEGALAAALVTVNTAYEGAEYTVDDLNNATISSLISDAHGAKNSAESKIAALEAYQAAINSTELLAALAAVNVVYEGADGAPYTIASLSAEVTSLINSITISYARYQYTNAYKNAVSILDAYFSSQAELENKYTNELAGTEGDRFTLYSNGSVKDSVDIDDVIKYIESTDYARETKEIKERVSDMLYTVSSVVNQDINPTKLMYELYSCIGSINNPMIFIRERLFSREECFKYLLRDFCDAQIKNKDLQAKLRQLESFLGADSPAYKYMSLYIDSGFNVNDPTVYQYNFGYELPPDNDQTDALIAETKTLIDIGRENWRKKSINVVYMGGVRRDNSIFDRTKNYGDMLLEDDGIVAKIQGFAESLNAIGQDGYATGIGFSANLSECLRQFFSCRLIAYGRDNDVVSEEVHAIDFLLSAASVELYLELDFETCGRIKAALEEKIRGINEEILAGIKFSDSDKSAIPYTVVEDGQEISLEDECLFFYDRNGILRDYDTINEDISQLKEAFAAQQLKVDSAALNNISEIAAARLNEKSEMDDIIESMNVSLNLAEDEKFTYENDKRWKIDEFITPFINEYKEDINDLKAKLDKLVFGTSTGVSLAGEAALILASKIEKSTKALNALMGKAKAAYSEDELQVMRESIIEESNLAVELLFRRYSSIILENVGNVGSVGEGGLTDEQRNTILQYFNNDDVEETNNTLLDELLETVNDGISVCLNALAGDGNNSADKYRVNGDTYYYDILLRNIETSINKLYDISGATGLVASYNKNDSYTEGSIANTITTDIEELLAGLKTSGSSFSEVVNIDASATLGEVVSALQSESTRLSDKYTTKTEEILNRTDQLSAERENLANAIWNFNSTLGLSGIIYTGKELNTMISNLEKDIAKNQSSIDALNSAATALRTAVETYNDIEGVNAAAEKFDAVKNAANALNLEVRKHLSATSVPTLEEYNQIYSSSISDIKTYDNYYKYVSSFISLMESSNYKEELGSYYYGNDGSLKEFSYQDMSNWVNKLTMLLNEKNFDYGSNLNAYNKMVSSLTVRNYSKKTSSLLSLCMLSSTPIADENGEYNLVNGIERIDNGDGTYSYSLVVNGSKKINESEFDEAFTKVDACKRLAMPYFALAIMYEKVAIQQMILVEQLEQIEKINDDIAYNNKMLKALTWIYDYVYFEVTKNNNQRNCMLHTEELKTNTEVSLKELNEYLNAKVKNGGFKLGQIEAGAESNCVIATDYMTMSFARSHYNRDGDNGKSGRTENIDVREQSVLTILSNFQDQTRMYGDQLSTDANLMTTKMQQYMQDANACVSACTQTVKSIGDYFKTIISNIR